MYSIVTKKMHKSYNPLKNVFEKCLNKKIYFTLVLLTIQEKHLCTFVHIDEQYFLLQNQFGKDFEVLVCP